MASNKLVRFGPIAVPSSIGNLFNPPTLTGGVNPPSGSNTYMIFRHIRVVNKTAGIVNFSGYVGLTGGNAAGTEFIGIATPVQANLYIDWYGVLRLDVADFFTGFASAATSLVIVGEGEFGIA